MLVKDRMKPQPLVVVAPDTVLTEAQQLMQDHGLRHLPVVTGQDHLVGLITRQSILQAIPWSAVSLSALETRYILSKIRVDKVMLRDVVTVTEDVPVEEAARIMVDHGTGCLPVVRGDTLVGLITDVDLLSTMMEMLGAREPGLRLSVIVPNRVGEMAKLSAAIAEIGGNLTAFGSWAVERSPERLGIVLRVDRVSKEQLLATVQKLPEVEILDVREM
ncbi:MAG: CBS domain-containing protein [Chloroflexi bacterium]|nr:CBS domain-containing protein [Chloroflexota bacterium]